jgi:hypothetical protein
MTPDRTFYGTAPMTGSQLADAIAHLRFRARTVSQSESECEEQIDALLKLDPKRKTQ